MVNIDQTENRVNELLDRLIKTGSKIERLNEFKQEIVDELKKDKSLESVLEDSSKVLVEMVQGFLDKKNYTGTQLITGISYCVYMPSYIGNGTYTLKILGGYNARKVVLPTELMQKKYPHSHTIKIDDQNSSNKVGIIGKSTAFDAASITKLFTLLLTYKLEELGYINLDDKIVDLNPRFSGLEDFTIRDLIRLCGDIGTVELDENGEIKRDSSGKPVYARIDKLDQTTEEAYEILYNNLRVLDNTRETNKYTDMGAIVLGDTISEVMSRKTGIKMSFAEIMDKYIIKPLGLKETCFNPNSANISGNNGFEVQDGKARKLGGACGHAGLFITNDDLIPTADYIFQDPELAKRLGERTFPNSPLSRRGNFGMYLPDPGGYPATFTPPEFSDASFSMQGWTGSAVMFDPINYIENGILLNTVCEDYEGNVTKPGNDPSIEEYSKKDGFMPVFERFQASSTREFMKEYVMKEYYNIYANVKNDFCISKRLYK